MNTRNKTIRRWSYILLILFLVGAIMVACVNLISVSYDQDEIDAGEVATFRMNVEIRPIANQSEETRLVIGFCAPKAWKPRENTTIEYENSQDPGVICKMVLIPTDISPSLAPGLTWENALWNRFGAGPNVLDDMQWVAFWSNENKPVSNGQNMDIKVTIKVQTSEQNLRAKLGFFLNHTHQGMNSDVLHHGIDWGSCFEVVNGEGEIIDFCDLHPNMNLPGNATKNDIITIKYLGGIMENDPLEGMDDIYLSAIAHTDKGNSYARNSRQDESRMPKEGTFGRTFGLTFWPAGYFGIPDGEEITRIDYFFTDKTGTAQLMEQVTDDDGNIIGEVPFRFIFDCK